MAFAHLGDHGKAWELASMINPIHHASDAAAAQLYKVEPYVLAADVYGVAPHIGRGGWTWYTGSAGWMYRLLTESLLGLHREGDQLSLKPCIPADWNEYKLHYRHGGSMYLITVTQVDGGKAGLSVDGFAQKGLRFQLVDDESIHHVEATWPRPG
jgi:cellobiose phosphorylase